MKGFMYAGRQRRRPLGIGSSRPTLALFTRFAAILVALVLAAGSGTALAQFPPVFDFKLINSEIVAESTSIGPGQEVTFTVILRNSAANADTVDVTVQHPTELAYVAGSASGASYSAGDRALSWEDIPVGANGEARRSFKLRSAGTVSSNTSVTVGAAIAGVNERIIRITTVTVQPGGTPPPSGGADLSGSSKRASSPTLRSNQRLNYTIVLRNTGSASATVNVSDPLPAQLEYVDGTASGGGSYSSATRTLSWTGVNVGANATVELTFGARVGTVSSVAQIVNTATISAGGSSITRSASTQLVPDVNPDPEPEPGKPLLAASLKLPSKFIVRNGDTVEYTILLYNNGSADAVVTVSDTLPEELDYVADSASVGAAYDAASRTLTWRGLAVGKGRQLILSYDAKVDQAVELPRPVTNTARITVGEATINRSAVVTIVPGTPPPGGSDVTPPRVTGVTIGSQDVLRQTTTTLQVAASDNVGVTEMNIREWRLNSSRAFPRWELVRASGWQAFAESVPWELGSQAGTHYVGVQVRDAAGNVSPLTPAAIDFASVLIDNTAIGQGRVIFYQVYYPEGTKVEAALTSRSGDPDLFVWFPGSMLLPDEASFNEGETRDSVSFTAPRSGRYIFAVFGFSEARYDLSITPPGGARLSNDLLAAPADVFAVASIAATKQLPSAAALLGGSGLDPLGTADLGNNVYLPMVRRP